MLSRKARWALVGAGFALGCVPTARIVSRRKGVDIDSVGTGNPGAANVRRALGARSGALVLAIDAAKGATPVLVGRALDVDDGTLGALAMAPIMGHITVVGGKGAGAALGAVAATDPAALAVVSPLMAVSAYPPLHTSSILVIYLVLPLVRRRLGRSRAAVAWTGALMGLLIGARLWGTGAGRLRNRRVLWERLVYDREPPDESGR